jgi:hypothetical protein
LKICSALVQAFPIAAGIERRDEIAGRHGRQKNRPVAARGLIFHDLRNTVCPTIRKNEALACPIPPLM